MNKYTTSYVIFCCLSTWLILPLKTLRQDRACLGLEKAVAPQLLRRGGWRRLHLEDRVRILLEREEGLAYVGEEHSGWDQGREFRRKVSAPDHVRPTQNCVVRDLRNGQASTH